MEDLEWPAQSHDPIPSKHLQDELEHWLYVYEHKLTQYSEEDIIRAKRE